MPGPLDIVINGVTSETTGRFILAGETFQFVADGSKPTGGPGLAPGASHLLAASFATCALNIYRGAVEPELAHPRSAQIRARLSRAGDGERFRLQLEAEIDGIDDAEAERLRGLYIENCSLYAAFRETVDFVIAVRPRG